MSNPEKVVLWARKTRISLTFTKTGWGKLPNKKIFGVWFGVVRISRSVHRVKAGEKILTWR